MAKAANQPHRLRCPECASQKVWKDGLRYTKHREVQRWLCRCCGYRFSGVKQDPVPQLQIEKDVVFQPFKKLDARPDLTQIPIGDSCSTAEKSLDDSPFPVCEDVSPHDDPDKSTVGKTINPFASTIVNAKCALGEKAKNLVKVETRQKRAAGATKPTSAELRGRLVEHVFWLKKNGYAESTITKRTYVLKSLMKQGANLLDPESVKETLAHRECSENTKASIVYAYAAFLKMVRIKWNPPRYKQTRKLPFIPTETEIDQLIAGSGRKAATLLQLLKETGMRVGEALRLNWIDIDTKRNTITLNYPEKRGNPRMFKASSELIAMLNLLPKRCHKVFGNTLLVSIANNFRNQRRKVANKLGNPRIMRISFHTLRHFRATMEYHKTKDILHVKELLGHRNINNTLIYTQLVSFESDEYHVKVAKTLKEACGLAEAGFDYFTTIDGAQIFRKRK